MSLPVLLRHLRSLWLLLAFALASPLAHADTPVTLFKSWAGHVNFTGTEVTLRNSGTNQCTVYGTKKNDPSLSKALSSIPAGATIEAAYLYWAGSGTTTTDAVTFNGSTVNAQRTYAGTYTQGGQAYSYFARAAEVTVSGNGTYTFKPFVVDTSSKYCTVQGVLGGFALLVVYSHPSEPFRVLNMYEGFQFTHDSTVSPNTPVTLNLSNFKVPNPLGTNTGRIGHVTWEGDQSLNQQGENLAFNGTVLTDALNPAGNQFDSKSNIDGDQASYGIDFDAYTIGDPIIKAGDITATTTYSSGQDLVWLNVEIVAVPNVPTADLSVAVTRTGTPAAGATVTYTATVTNNGPDVATAPVTFTNQLPDGMSYVSLSGGPGWSCSYSGQNGTCTYNGDLASGQSAPAITIQGKVNTMYSSFVESAAVAGQVFDNNTDNNNATDAWLNVTGTGWMFTDRRCVPNAVIGSSGNCQPYNGPYTAASQRSLWITYYNNGVATAYNKKNTTVAMRFSLTCDDPQPASGTGVAWSFGDVGLSQCTNGAMPATSNTSLWTQNCNITLNAGEASGILGTAAPIFQYKDVGKVQLNLYEVNSNPARTAFAQFTSVPKMVHFTLLQNSNGGLPEGSGGFARAGEQFYANIKVEMDDGNSPPHFGSPHVATIAQSGGTGALYIDSLLLSGDTYVGKLRYEDLGSLDLTATITSSGNYAPGTYFGLPITTETKTISTFYPGYFTTTVDGGVDCVTLLAHVHCPTGSLPAGENLAIARAVYSGQPFSLTVNAFSMTGTNLSSKLAASASFPVDLAAVTLPGSTGTTLPVATGTLSLPSPATITLGGASATSMPTLAAVSLANPYQTGIARPAAGWTSPTSAYIRASSGFTRKIAGGTQTDTVSSNRGPGGQSVEGGMRVMAGRLWVDNANGSELIKLPLYLHSQYWTGSGWENNAADSASPVNNTALFSNCTATLKAGTTGCIPQVALQTGAAITLNQGAGALWMLAPGPGNHGAVNSVSIPGAPVWLPSTIAKAVFGTYKSRMVYLREVY